MAQETAPQGVEEFQKELERQVSAIVKEINNLKSDDIEKFLNEAVDIQVIKYLGNDELAGFDILITFGGHNIEFMFNRGAAKVIGTWGGYKVEQSVNIDVANEILDYLQY